MQKENYKILLVLALAFIFLGYLGYDVYQRGEIATPPTTPTSPTTPTTPTDTEYSPAIMKWTIQDAITGTSHDAGDTAYVDISVLDNGVFDPLSKSESQEFNADPDSSALTYAYGDTIVCHVCSDYTYEVSSVEYGNETYDRWFYFTLKPNEPVKELTASCLSASQSSPTYKYTINDVGPATGYKVQYAVDVSGGFYWGLGAFELYTRAGDAHVDLYMQYAGTTMASVTDGSSWDDELGDQVADVTLATDTEDMELRVIAGCTDVCYGLPQLIVSQSGKIEEYRAVAVIATNATSIGLSTLAQDGWLPVNKVDVTAELIFYKIIDPQIPTRGTKFDFSLEISIDAASLTASTAYSMDAWFHDINLPSNVANGAPTGTLPTVYGMMTELGCDDMVHTEVMTVTSGATETEQLFGDWTTAS